VRYLGLLSLSRKRVRIAQEEPDYLNPPGAFLEAFPGCLEAFPGCLLFGSVSGCFGSVSGFLAVVFEARPARREGRSSFQESPFLPPCLRTESKSCAPTHRSSEGERPANVRKHPQAPTNTMNNNSSLITPTLGCFFRSFGIQEKRSNELLLVLLLSLQPLRKNGSVHVESVL